MNHRHLATLFHLSLEVPRLGLRLAFRGPLQAMRLHIYGAVGSITLGMISTHFIYWIGRYSSSLSRSFIRERPQCEAALLMFALYLRRYPPNSYSVRSTMLHHQIMATKFFTFAPKVTLPCKIGFRFAREGIHSSLCRTKAPLI